MADELTFEITSDGRSKVTTDLVSQPNHQNSETVLKTIAQLTGGPATRKARTDIKKGKHQHHHSQKS